MRRVVVSGMGIVSSIGNNSQEVTASLREAKSGIVAADDYIKMGFRSQVHGSLKLDLDQVVDRRARRFQGDGAGYCWVAMTQAIQDAGIKVSLATVYNTLHQFTAAGLLRQVVVDASRSYFDTNIGDHQHFYCEDEGRLIDIPGETIAVAGVPAPPKGTTIDRVDVVIRLRRA